LSYDAENRVVSVSGAATAIPRAPGHAFVYNGDENRTKIVQVARTKIVQVARTKIVQVARTKIVQVARTKTYGTTPSTYHFTGTGGLNLG
jgi:hypothetical protein